ncbi:hypothetical protein HAT91_02508 [Dickeya solani]|nr:hypothetical protein HAT91_02508 [Dickeya solani]
MVNHPVARLRRADVLLQFAFDAAFRVHDHLHQLQNALGATGVRQQIGQPPPAQLLSGKTQMGQCSGVGVLAVELRIKTRNQIRRILHQRPELLLAGVGQLFDMLAFTNIPYYAHTVLSSFM